MSLRANQLEILKKKWLFIRWLSKWSNSTIKV